MQSKMLSLAEAAFNTASGFVISVLASFVIFPAFGAHIPVSSNIKIVTAFTIISVIRSYVWRRLFNRIEKEKP